MRKSRFSEEQIIGIVKRVEAGQPVADVCREVGISDGTYYRWKAQYGGLEVSQPRRLRQLEDENRKRKAGGGRPDAGPSRLEGHDCKKRVTPTAALLAVRLWAI